MERREYERSVMNAKKPVHYQGKRFQLWDVILDFNLTYFEANIVKYVVRWRKKNGLEDLYKAREYLNNLIAEEEKKPIITAIGEEFPESIDG